MNLLKKLWNFLFGSKEEKDPHLELYEDVPEPEEKMHTESVQHCMTHLRFRKNCPDCLRAVGVS
jgi:hypothetical protein|tara:strand:- start:108 stop:299 length:192 start_codon:yes stop_codon:yes gene_type:complete